MEGVFVTSELLLGVLDVYFGDVSEGVLSSRGRKCVYSVMLCSKN